MSERQPGGESSPADRVDGFQDDSKHSAAEVLVERTIESSFAAERFSADAVFDILSHPGQRYVLTYLLQSSGTVSLQTLIDYAASESDVAADSYSRRNIVIELTHTVLPKLADNGFIEYDRERQLVEPTELTAIVEPYLRIALVQQERAAELQTHRR